MKVWEAKITVIEKKELTIKELIKIGGALDNLEETIYAAVASKIPAKLLDRVTIKVEI